MRALLIPPAGEAEHVEVAGLDDLQRLVGGFIEGVPLAGRSDAIAYINEEGKLQGLAPNARATELCHIFPGDYIAGPAVIVGANRATGEERDVPADISA